MDEFATLPLGLKAAVVVWLIVFCGWGVFAVVVGVMDAMAQAEARPNRVADCMQETDLTERACSFLMDRFEQR